MVRLPRHALVLGAALGALALGGPSSRAAAQAPPAGTVRGWVGMSVQIPLIPEPGSQAVRALVTGVSEGGPAARAGVRVGDVLLSIDGHGAEDGFGGITQTLRAGERVTMVVERAGRRHRIRMRATARPDTLLENTASLPWTPSLGSDSMADMMFRAMDSLRMRLIQGESGLPVVVTLPWPAGVPVTGDMPAPEYILLRSASGNPTGVFGPPGRDTITTIELLPEVRPAFSFFVFRSGPTDSLQSRMDAIDARIRELRARQSQRLRELAAEFPGGQEQVDANDPELRQLAWALDAASRRAADLIAAMEEVAREEAARGDRIRNGTANPVESTTEGPVDQVSFRPLAPYVLGQDRAAGAEMVRLRPELAQYFQVRGGVLVVDVPAGTPAALAGVRPGDVLTSVNGTPIHTIRELRVGLARAGTGPLRLTLVRKGRTLRVLLPR